MTDLIHKFSLKLSQLSILCFVVGICATQQAIADHSKKTSDRSKSGTSAWKYATPGVSAAEVVVTALGRQVSTTNRSGKTSLASDTVKKESRIIFVRATADVFTARVEIATEEANLDIGIYNMLGKKMADVYRGPSAKGEREFTTPISDLPEGVYICILQASNTRRAEKFYLSR